MSNTSSVELMATRHRLKWYTKRGNSSISSRPQDITGLFWAISGIWTQALISNIKVNSSELVSTMQKSSSTNVFLGTCQLLHGRDSVPKDEVIEKIWSMFYLKENSIWFWICSVESIANIFSYALISNKPFI